MFERFTHRARRIPVLAQEEARSFNHDYIGTEHLLAGLARKDEHSHAYRALRQLEVSNSDVRQLIKEIIGEGGVAEWLPLPFTPRCKKAIELSLREALQLGHNYIGPEHLLLGLIREGEGVACQILIKLGVDLHQVRSSVLHELSGFQPKHAAEPQSQAPPTDLLILCDNSTAMGGGVVWCAQAIIDAIREHAKTNMGQIEGPHLAAHLTSVFGKLEG